MSDFVLGRPALVCRWRLAGTELPLENRHLRALSRRTVGGEGVSAQLVAWAKQHVEWTLAGGAATCPNGVLMLVIDEAGRAAMSVGPYEPLAEKDLAALAARAEAGAQEASATGVAPETLWAVRDGSLLWGAGEKDVPSGAASLVLDLARTLGTEVVRDPGLMARLAQGSDGFDEAFLVSDEHGVVAAEDAAGPRGAELARDYAALLASCSARSHDAASSLCR